MPKHDKNSPIQRIKAFPLTVAIWRNQTPNSDRPWYSVTMERSYKKEDGTYGNSEALNRDDLLLGAKLIDQAHSFILRQEAKDHVEAKGGE